jgi:hypothetical protein
MDGWMYVCMYGMQAHAKQNTNSDFVLHAHANYAVHDAHAHKYMYIINLLYIVYDTHTDAHQKNISAYINILAFVHAYINILSFVHAYINILAFEHAQFACKLCSARCKCT